MGSKSEVIARMTQFSVQIMQMESMGSSKFVAVQKAELRGS